MTGNLNLTLATVSNNDDQCRWFPTLSTHITNQPVLRISIPAKPEQQKWPLSWKLISKHRAMLNVVGFRLDSLVDSLKKERNMEIGCKDGLIGVQWVIVLAQSGHVDKQVRAVRKNECTQQKRKIVATRADGDVCNCVWCALRYCYCSSPLTGLQIKKWMTQWPGERLAFPENNCKSASVTYLWKTEQFFALHWHKIYWIYG